MRYKALFVTIACILLCIILFILFIWVHKTTQKTSLESAYSALETSLIVELSDYFRINGKYPNSLDMLSTVVYSDGATPEMLSHFKYVTNGDSCEISHISPLYGSERTSCLSKGKIVVPGGNERNSGTDIGKMKD